MDYLVILNTEGGDEEHRHTFKRGTILCSNRAEAVRIADHLNQHSVHLFSEQTHAEPALRVWNAGGRGSVILSFSAIEHIIHDWQHADTTKRMPKPPKKPRLFPSPVDVILGDDDA